MAVRARSAGIWGLLVASVVLAALLVPGFATPTNLGNVVTQSAALGFVAIGQTFVIAAGLIDLSVGQLVGLSVVLMCALADGRGELLLPVALGILALGALVGTVHGWLLNKLSLEPLILTFGSLSILQGVIFTYTDRSVGRAPEALRWIANERLLGFPVAGLLLVALGLLAHGLLRHTRFGLRLLATGDDGESARRAGVPVMGIRWGAFVLSGVGAALGGLLVAGRLGTGYPNAGQGFELDAIVAAVLGGTSLAGGRASIVGTLGAVLVLGVIANVLNLLEVSAFVQTLAKGLIVVAAILVTRGPRIGWRMPAATRAPAAPIPTVVSNGACSPAPHASRSCATGCRAGRSSACSRCCSSSRPSSVGTSCTTRSRRSSATRRSRSATTAACARSMPFARFAGRACVCRSCASTKPTHRRRTSSSRIRNPVSGSKKATT